MVPGSLSEQHLKHLAFFFFFCFNPNWISWQMLEQELAGWPGDTLEVALSVAGEPCVPRLGAGCKLGGTFLVLGAGNQHDNLSLWRRMERRGPCKEGWCEITCEGSLCWTQQEEDTGDSSDTCARWVPKGTGSN